MTDFQESWLIALTAFSVSGFFGLAWALTYAIRSFAEVVDAQCDLNESIIKKLPDDDTEKASANE